MRDRYLIVRKHALERRLDLVDGLASDVNDGGRIHGKDERVLVKSFYQGEDYLYRLVKMLAGGG